MTWLIGERWPRDDLTYQVTRYTNDLSRSAIDSEIRRAFDAWSDVSAVTFTQLSDNDQNEADIRIVFAGREHGDNAPFDGPSGVLAHAYYPSEFINPLEGDSHFDDDEMWTLNTING